MKCFYLNPLLYACVWETARGVARAASLAVTVGGDLGVVRTIKAEVRPDVPGSWQDDAVCCLITWRRLSPFAVLYAQDPNQPWFLTSGGTRH